MDLRFPPKVEEVEVCSHTWKQNGCVSCCLATEELLDHSPTAENSQSMVSVNEDCQSQSSLNDLQEQERQLDMRLQHLERMGKRLDEQLTFPDYPVDQIPMRRMTHEKEHWPLQTRVKVERFSPPPQLAEDLLGCSRAVHIPDYKPLIFPNSSDCRTEPEHNETDNVRVGDMNTDQAVPFTNGSGVVNYRNSNEKWSVNVKRHDATTRYSGRGRRSWDSYLAATHRLPATADRFVTMPLSTLNQLLKREDLNEYQKILIKRIRRRGMNRMCAQRWRAAQAGRVRSTFRQEMQSNGDQWTEAERNEMDTLFIPEIDTEQEFPFDMENSSDLPSVDPGSSDQHSEGERAVMESTQHEENPAVQPSEVVLMGVDIRDYKCDVPLIPDQRSQPKMANMNGTEIEESNTDEVLPAEKKSVFPSARCGNLNQSLCVKTGGYFPRRNKGRLRDELLAASHNLPATIDELAEMSMKELKLFFARVKPTEEQKILMKEIRQRGINRLNARRSNLRRAQGIPPKRQRKNNEKVPSVSDQSDEPEVNKTDNVSMGEANTDQGSSLEPEKSSAGKLPGAGSGKRRGRPCTAAQADKKLAASHHLPATVDELVAMSMRELKLFFERVKPTEEQKILMKEIRQRGINRLNARRSNLRRAQGIPPKRQRKNNEKVPSVSDQSDEPEVNKTDTVSMGEANTDQGSSLEPEKSSAGKLPGAGSGKRRGRPCTAAQADEKLAASHHLPTTVDELVAMSMRELKQFFERVKPTEEQKILMKELRQRGMNRLNARRSNLRRAQGIRQNARGKRTKKVEKGRL